MPSIHLISWNIHRGRGGDGQVDPARTLRVLQTEVWRSAADALFLQEADAEAPPHAGVLDIAKIERITGLRHLQNDKLHRSSAESQGFLGVVAFLHPDWEVEALQLVDLPGLCPRGAVVVDCVKNGQAVRLLNTHLSLCQPLRIVQMRTLGQLLTRLPQRPTVICGDLNEWRPWGGLAFSPKVIGARFTGPAKRSFPVNWPLFPLDRALSTGCARTTVLDGPGIRAASDHRPIAAEVNLDV